MPLLSKSSHTYLRGLIANPPQAILIVGNVVGNNNQVASWLAESLTTLGMVLKFGQDGLKIDDVREIARIVRVRNSKSEQVRVIQIVDFQNAKLEAQNAMLKILEQPVQGVMYIISTSNSSKVLNTIKSRAIVVSLTSPSLGEYQRYFAQISPSNVESAFIATSGDLTLTGKYLEGDDKPLILAKQILTSDMYQRLGLIDQLTKDKILLHEVITYIQNILVYKMRLSPNEAPKYSEKIKLSVELLTQSSNNANAKLLLLRLFINL